MIKQLLIATCLLVCSSVFAGAQSNWQLFAKSDDFSHYYDKNKITKLSGSTTKELQVWVKTVMNRNFNEFGQLGDYALIQKQINCADHKIKDISRVMYLKTGKLIGVDNAVHQYSNVPPDSTGDSTIKVMCEFVYKQG